ncbi:MAG TPA: class I SAM-dependent methyltransferase [Patescibacteria group bacterium]
MDYEDSTLSVYDKNALDYHSRLASDFQKSERDKFIKLMPLDPHVLDLGCGTGRDALAFQDQGFDILAVDGATGMINLAQKFGVKNTRVLKYSQLDTLNCTFDGIWASYSLLHLSKSDLPKVIKNIKHLLKSPGIFYASFRQGDGEELRTNDRYGGGRFFAYYTEAELKRIFSEFFRNVTIQKITGVDPRGGLAVWVVKE